ncbi:hypothetical protein BJ508DRAFT_410052 [Ascobolus immersus RN42]|uniref:Ferric oxidoreductase domain-containing protein n=1 Tax=Ascobolus immersus RN42 TaxID=1160509 RepID=A0A3N4IRZ1_ASCIM|nr:hypothetical protein BJ508DRAFT_410052 [Ascobolus immersus RN42]
MLSYTFPALTPAQQSARREALNFQGYLSLALPVGLLFILAIPYLGTNATPPKTAPKTGPTDHLLSTLLYTLTLLTIATYQTAPDGLHLIKALGHVAGAQIPIVYLLSSRSNQLSPAHVWGWGKVRGWHVVVARAVALLVVGHVGGYLYFFVKTDRLFRLSQRHIIFGELAFFGFLAIMMTAWTKDKKGGYKWFQRVHFLVAPTLLPALYLHVNWIRPYILLTGVLYALGRPQAWRFFTERAGLKKGH